MTRFTRILCVALLASVVSAPAFAQSPLDKRVTLDLKAVEPGTAFETIASAIGLEVKVDPAVTAPVDIVVRNVRARTALDTICDSIGCRWTQTKTTLSILPGVASRTEAEAFSVRGDAQAKRLKVERVQEALAKKLPDGLVFDHAPLNEVGERLSGALGLQVSIENATGEDVTLTADFSGLTLQEAFKVLADEIRGTGTWSIIISRKGEEPQFGLKVVSRPTRKK